MPEMWVACLPRPFLTVVGVQVRVRVRMRMHVRGRDG